MDRSTSLCTQHSGVRRCAEARGASGAPVAPELVDPAEDGRAHAARQLLAHGDGQLLVDLSLAPWLLRLVPKAKVPSAGRLHAVEGGRALADYTGKVLRDVLQADSGHRGWACGVAARRHPARGSWSLALSIALFHHGKVRI